MAVAALLRAVASLGHGCIAVAALLREASAATTLGPKPLLLLLFIPKPLLLLLSIANPLLLLPLLPLTPCYPDPRQHY